LIVVQGIPGASPAKRLPVLHLLGGALIEDLGRGTRRGFDRGDGRFFQHGRNGCERLAVVLLRINAPGFGLVRVALFDRLVRSGFILLGVRAPFVFDRGGRVVFPFDIRSCFAFGGYGIGGVAGRFRVVGARGRLVPFAVLGFAAAGKEAPSAATAAPTPTATPAIFAIDDPRAPSSWDCDAASLSCSSFPCPLSASSVAAIRNSPSALSGLEYLPAIPRRGAPETVATQSIVSKPLLTAMPHHMEASSEREE
jgi:hypothetical protein